MLTADVMKGSILMNARDANHIINFVKGLIILNQTQSTIPRDNHLTEDQTQS
jgi:hypothetical protein